MAATILIADDDAVQRRLVENMVQKCGYEAVVVDSGDAAIALLTAPDAPVIDALVLDLVMPGLDGMGVLAKIREAGLSIPVIVQTAHGGIDNVVSAMRAGAQDFVVKPVGMERLQVSLRNALNTSALKGELQRIRHSREGRLTFADIITRSEAMAGVMRTAQEGSGLDHSGADRGRIRRRQGIVRARHPWQRRAQIEAVRRRQLRRDPRQSRGVDFVRPRKGRLHRRDRTPHRQIRRSLRRHAVPRRSLGTCRWPPRSNCCARCRKARSRRSAARKPVKVDVRIVSATNRKLLDRVKSGHFREDLFYRLHVLPLTVPSVAHAPRGYPASGAAFPRAFLRRGKPPHHRHQRRSDGASFATGLARQYPSARERRLPRRRDERERSAWSVGFPASRGAMPSPPTAAHGEPLIVEHGFHATAPAINR